MKNTPTTLSTLSKLSLLLIGFLALATSSFGAVYQLDKDIKPDADGVYNVPENAEFLIELVGQNAVEPTGAELLSYEFSSIDDSNITYEKVTCDHSICWGDLVHYDFFFNATKTDNHVRTITFVDNQGGSIFKKVKVTDSQDAQITSQTNEESRDQANTYIQPDKNFQNAWFNPRGKRASWFLSK